MPSPFPTQVIVKGMTLDSRRARPGDLFFAVPGSSTDGREYVPEAITSGVSAVLAEAPYVGTPPWGGTPIIEVENLRPHIGWFAARFFDWPCKNLHPVAVTGTNGKSSVCYWTMALLENLGVSAGICGTLGCGRIGRLRPQDCTTPDAIGVQSALAHLAGVGCKWALLEASSHGLAQGRLDAVPLRFAVFTNLTHDHLDYHGDMDTYWRSKRRLFEWPQLEGAIINVDNEHGASLADELGDQGSAVLRCGFGAQADVRFTAVRTLHRGFCATLKIAQQEARVFLATLGEFNLANLLLCAGILHAARHSFEEIVAALTHLPVPPGRMQASDVGGRLVVVDYAHTPDALRNVLQTLRGHYPGRLLCVFGCGGDRDRAKRPLMGAVAADLADEVILTEDNSRGEDRALILADIQRGCGYTEHVRIIPDRRDAIWQALGRATADDTVLIAGKGHERYQFTGGATISLSDQDLVDQFAAESG